jgi:hypothetical protein
MGRSRAFTNIVDSDPHDRQYSVVHVCVEYVRLLVTLKLQLLQPKDYEL